MRSVSKLAIALGAVWIALTAIAVLQLTDMKSRQSQIFGTVEWINRAEAVHAELDDLHAFATSPGAPPNEVARRVSDRLRLDADDTARFAPNIPEEWDRLQRRLDDTDGGDVAPLLDQARRVVRNQVRQVRSSLEATTRTLAGIWLTLMCLFVGLLVGAAVLGYTFTRALTRARLLEELREGAELLSGSLQIEIREFRDAMRALEKSEARYRGVVEMQTEMISRCEPDGRLKFVNEAYARSWGKRPDELVGTNFLALVAEADREEVRAYLASFSKELQIQSHEHRVLAPDGTVAWQLWTDRALFNSGGEIVEFQSTGRDVTQRREAQEALLASEQRLRILAARLQTAREDERAAIARELHDDLGQSLTRLRFEIVLASKACLDDGLRERMGEMLGLVDAAIEGVRRAASQLRPPLLDSMGLPAALDWQAEEFGRHTGITCVRDVDDVRVPPDVAIALFRVVQEALTNVARHANAHRVVVRLYRDVGRAVVEVEDDGCGIDDTAARDPLSTGLVNMRERAEALGGEFRIESPDGRGTRIVFAVPAEGQEEAA